MVGNEKETDPAVMVELKEDLRMLNTEVGGGTDGGCGIF